MDEYIADYEYARSISCIGESASVSASFGEDKVVVTAYENIFIWDINTLSVHHMINYNSESVITAISCIPTETSWLLIGHLNGTVRVIDFSGNEIFGFREHIKQINGISSTEDTTVVYTTSAFTVVDLRTESVICTVSLDIPISLVKIVDQKIAVGTIRGIVHTYEITDLLNGVQEAEIYPLPLNHIVGFLVVDGTIYSADSERLINIKTKEEIPLKHRVSFFRSHNSSIFTRDAKNKYRLLTVKENKIEEVCVFKNTRPLASMELFSNKGVCVFADNGIGVTRIPENSTTVEAGRSNLIGVVENAGTILGITETEGKVFARSVKKDELEVLDISAVLFEDPGMHCISVYENKYYIGKSDGSVCIRNSSGEVVQNIKVSESPVVSLDVQKSILALGTGNRVILLEGSTENYERDELDYEDEVVCVRISVDSSLIFTSLADNTVKVHKIDGTKVLSLYGHSVPVVDICVCLEKSVVFTLGGDKLVKVWGLRHGECRRTINPVDPSGITLFKNLLIVSTASGLIYYLKDTLEKVKKIEYKTGKQRAVPGQNRIAVVDSYMGVIRERALSLFTEGEYGTSVEEQRQIEEKKTEIEEIAKEKKIYKIGAVEALENALEENNPKRVFSALKALSQNDVEKTVEIMNAETQEKFLNALYEIPPKNNNPLALAWSFNKLLEKNPNNPKIEQAMEAVRKELRVQARMAMANRAGILWSISE